MAAPASRDGFARAASKSPRLDEALPAGQQGRDVAPPGGVPARSPHRPSRSASAVSPSNPAAGRGPRSTRSSRRAPSSQPSRSPSAITNGCLSKASRGTGANRSAAAAAAASSKVPGGVCESGRPAESSASIPQRFKCADTRRARPRSGVTNAAVRPGSSSAPRSAIAIACASSAGSESSSARTPERRRSAGRSAICR